MIRDNKVIVVDVDGTLTIEDTSHNYANAKISQSLKSKLITLKSEGYWIVLYTSRNMRTYGGNLGLILKNTAPILIRWLENNNVPYDELHFGKPWCGYQGFYVDDRAIRPREFVELSIDQITKLIEKDKLSQ